MDPKMKTKSSDTVTSHLEKIGCWPVPPFIVTKLESEVSDALTAAREKIIKKKVTYEAVTKAFKEASSHGGKKSELPDSLSVPPSLPSAQ